MKIYNNNSAFGDGGPFEAESFESLADEMADMFYNDAVEEFAMELYENAEDCFDQDAWLETRVAELRAEFIAGLTEVK